MALSKQLTDNYPELTCHFEHLEQTFLLCKEVHVLVKKKLDARKNINLVRTEVFKIISFDVSFIQIERK
jgi:hypothetical protein